MVRVLGIALVTAIWFVFGIANAHQTPCFPVLQGEARLIIQHSEIPFAVGTVKLGPASASDADRLWTAKFWRGAEGTWTVSITSPNNDRLCWWIVGENFRLIERREADDGNTQ